MSGIAVYIIGAIMATIQSVSLVFIWYMKRGLTKAEAGLTEAQAVLTKAQAASETSEASQTTANAFSTLTQVISQMGSEYSENLIKITEASSLSTLKFIEALNTREKKIDELEIANRRLTGDAEDFKKQFSEMAISGAQRDTKIELLEGSIRTLNIANGNQANELFEVKMELGKLRDENAAKDAAIQERDATIANMQKDIESRNARIEELEGKVAHLEAELALLKPPIVPVEVAVIEAKLEGANPS